MNNNFQITCGLLTAAPPSIRIFAHAVFLARIDHIKAEPFELFFNALGFAPAILPTFLRRAFTAWTRP